MRSDVVGRPSHFPSVFAWLSAGMWRNWRGLLGSLIAGYTGLPFALWFGAMVAPFAGVAGLLAGFGWQPPVLATVADLPMVAPALEAFLGRTALSAGLLGAVIGVVLGFLLGMLVMLLLIWGPAFADDPVGGVATVLGAMAGGLVISTGYVGYRVVFERALLHLSGARRMSRREHELIAPIVRGCAQRLGLRNYPPIMIDDSREPNALAYTRHIVLCRGLLAELRYDPEMIAGVVSHELVHWYNGDPISAAFVRGAALPVYPFHAAVGWVRRETDRSPLVTFLLWLILWPFLVTVRFLVMPLQAADSRRAELRADQGAVLAGHRDGLRQVLILLQRSFEGGRNGWTEAVCRTHPAVELRLEGLEDPARQYPLPDPDLPAGPAPVPVPRGGDR